MSALWPSARECARHLDVPRPAGRLGRPRPPGTSDLERDGTYMNLEAGSSACAARTSAAPDELAWIAKLAERFGVTLSPHAPQVFAELSERCYGGLDYTGIGDRARCPSGLPRSRCRASVAGRRARQSGLRLVTYRPLFSGPAVERVSELQFQRPAPEVELSAEDATKLGVEPGRRGQRPLQRHLGRASRAREQDSRGRSRPSGRRARPGSRHARGGRRMNEPWWIDVIKAVVIINLLLGDVRVPDVGRAEAARAHAAALRPQPSRPVRPPPADRRPGQADPQGELLPPVRGRAPLHRSAA